ncbi:MAG: hypothetical protein CO031_01055 [Candidatus Nealsonbacteria bacterium CG_4_9_14_0_2_um_filter_37_38]|uniref:Uncharacterized protein n=1 Tax=Candidatus Nealsonbacteria bacterium CG_4_10_14_0_8_um_filter_37_14 TaxID=1974684 RepID=A0A2M7R6P4_9BACT|nr:MAG: hypothetical protein COV63_02950 [Candidatus Nealsonbacteria bacterium CG11_big_fil_rev_8_21_14_0_20_37_68]PIW92228.1 MAG: hypothetical protein COZ89_00985 [Candidatus Nealsonbacteria bacterium CG_4_8_14_3_um_filter_37_23]PIY88523.1 MAG: hypothetical protein COY73_03570 [Candidatus Nealsonbacteria bacterium CG_4_10_14_0_8_um_filter_37_14]PJC51722.1 MAG: hypothetical protein CO031_01055 [Candidatus Nealsonbacteria bacterium CG_4_9_14_0_2_um_filter_37_38]
MLANAGKTKKAFWGMAKHHCLIFMILVIFGLIFWAFLFYKNFILIQNLEPRVALPKIQISKKDLQEVLLTLEKKGEKLEKLESKVYLNPFEKASEKPME